MEDDRTVLILQNVATAEGKNLPTGERNLAREQKRLAPDTIPAAMNVERRPHDKILPERVPVTAVQTPSASAHAPLGILDRKLSILIGLVLASLLLLLLPLAVDMASVRHGVAAVIRLWQEPAKPAPPASPSAPMPLDQLSLEAVPPRPATNSSAASATGRRRSSGGESRAGKHGDR